MDESQLPFLTRLRFSFVCWIRVLFDPAFAARAYAARDVKSEPAMLSRAPEARPESRRSEAPESQSLDAALQLLSLLQREGRFVDFVQQDIAAFGDADVAAAARVVHDGCRRAFAAHASIVSVREEAEGSRVVIDGETATAAVKLTGNVQGSAPYRGVLRHRGWRVQSLKLPMRVGTEDARVVAPAEVEL